MLSATREQLHNHLSTLKDAETLVIVEGKKDRQALELFGITKIRELSKKSLPALIDQVASSETECVILTDLDREGKKLYGKLHSGLQRQGIKINNKLRNFLYTETRIRNIEGLKN